MEKEEAPKSYRGPMYRRKYASDHDVIEMDALQHAFPLFRHKDSAPANNGLTERGSIISACFNKHCEIMPCFLIQRPTLEAMKQTAPWVDPDTMSELAERFKRNIIQSRGESSYVACESFYEAIDFDIAKKGPLLFRCVMETGGVVRNGKEVNSADYVAQIPWNTLIMVDKIAFTQNTYYFGPKHQLIRLRLANNMQIPGLNLSRSQMQGKRLWVSLYYNTREKNNHPYYRTAYDLLYKSKATSKEPGSLTFVFDLVGWAKTYFPACRSIEQKENHRNDQCSEICRSMKRFFLSGLTP